MNYIERLIDLVSLSTTMEVEKKIFENLVHFNNGQNFGLNPDLGALNST